jgi:hypothetical protein
MGHRLGDRSHDGAPDARLGDQVSTPSCRPTSVFSSCAIDVASRAEVEAFFLGAAAECRSVDACDDVRRLRLDTAGRLGYTGESIAPARNGRPLYESADIVAFLEERFG